MELGSMNQELHTKSIVLSDHAYKRVEERLGIKNKHEALGQIRGMLRQSTRIGETLDEDGNPAILYGFGRTAIFVSTDLKAVKTVIKKESVTYDPLKEKMKELHAKEIRKLTRTIGARKKDLFKLRDDVKIEVAVLEKRMHRTRSQTVKNECETKIKELNGKVSQLECKINGMETNKRHIAYSMVAVL